jgi:hypothetical protein
MRTMPGCQRRCGGAVAPDRREASVREAPSDDLAKPRPLKGMSKELWALGRAVQALQADDDATSAVSRPWGPDATARATRRPPADGRAEGTRCSLIARHLPGGVGDALHHRRPGGSIAAQGSGPSPWVWAPLPSPLDGSCGLARAPLGSDPRESQGSAAVPVCAHPAGGRAARGPCSPILSPDPLFASSVPTPANAPRRFVLGARGAAVPARHGLLPRPHEHRSVAHDRQVQHPAAGDRPRSQCAVGTRCAACRR